MPETPEKTAEKPVKKACLLPHVSCTIQPCGVIVRKITNDASAGLFLRIWTAGSIPSPGIFRARKRPWGYAGRAKARAADTLTLRSSDIKRRIAYEKEES